MSKSLLILILAFVFSGIVSAQNLILPRVSPQSSVSQKIGLTEIRVNYSRPAVKGRKILGELVPYNIVWRAGANENTTISFSDDVTIEGAKLPSGVYGFHTIPGEDEWILIFNKVNTAWGSFFYDENEDALRVRVKPEHSEYNEWMQFDFNNITASSVDINLKWENFKISFSVALDLHKIVLDNFRKQLVNVEGFSWQANLQAAKYCADNGVELGMGLDWVEKSILRNENFDNLSVKSRLLRMIGKTDEADKTLQKAFSIATEASINTYGYELLGQGKVEEALKMFYKNVANFPDSWNVYDSLAEALEKAGDKDSAIKNYSEALERAPDSQKQRIEKTIEALSKK